MTSTSNKPSILFLKFPYSSAFGGGERHTLAVADYLLQHGWRVFGVFSCRVLLSEFTKRGWPVRRLWIGREPVAAWSLLLFPLVFPWALLALVSTLLWYRFHHGGRVLYCLSLTEKVIATPWARLLGMRVVWVEHVNFGPWLTRNPLRFLYTLWSRLATVVAVSEAVRQDILQLGVASAHTQVIYNGIDLVTPTRLPAEAVLRFPKQFVIGTAARLEPEKGIAYLLKAAALLKEVVPHLKVVIIGTGSERQRLEWLAKQLGISHQVHFAGFQAELYQWLLGFDVFVLPSAKRESSGLVLAMAMACYVACVGSRLGGIPELITDNVTGLLVPPGDATALAEALRRLYFDPNLRLRLGKTAREFVRERYDEKRMLAEFEALLAG